MATLDYATDVEKRLFDRRAKELEEEISELEDEAGILHAELVEKSNRREQLEREWEVVNARVERLEGHPETE